MAKNPIVAAILSLFSGIGNIYLGLYKRFIVAFVIAAILSALTLISGIFLYIGLIVDIYYAYDSYIVAKAMNENQEIPKLFTVLDIQ
ncbi:hypothetical protein [Methanosphaera sp.]